MSQNEPTPVEDADVDQTVVLGAALLELDADIARLRRQVAHLAGRLDGTEHSAFVARQAALNVQTLIENPRNDTDRALSELMGMCDAVLIEKEPNGQVKATAVKGRFVLDSAGAYLADNIWEARAALGERAGGAITSLFAYMYHLQSDQFAGAAGVFDPTDGITAVRQITGLDELD